MTNIGEIFSANVRALRAKHGWTLKQLAEMVDSSPSTLCGVERGMTYPPPFAVLEKIAHIYGIAVADLFRSSAPAEKSFLIAATLDDALEIVNRHMRQGTIAVKRLPMVPELLEHPIKRDLPAAAVRRRRS